MDLKSLLSLVRHLTVLSLCLFLLGCQEDKDPQDPDTETEVTHQGSQELRNSGAIAPMNSETPGHPDCHRRSCEDDPPGSGGGNTCNALCRAQRLVSSIQSKLMGEVSEVTENVNDAQGAAEVSWANMGVLFNEAGKVELMNLYTGGTSGCSNDPVSLSCGSKITLGQDGGSGLIDFSRRHRISYGSGWSVGTGWHLSYDSRLIWGTAVLLDERIALLDDTISNLTAVIEDIETRKEYYEGHLNHSRQMVRDAAQNGIDTLDSYKQQLTPELEEVQSERALLVSERNKRDEHRHRNRYSVDPAHRAEEEIGNDKLKWVSPNGNRIIFEEDGSGYSPLGVNSYQLDDWSGGLVIRGAEGAYYRYNEAGLLVEQSDGQGGVVTLNRDSGQRITTISDNQGLVFQVSYSGNRVREVTDPAGRKLTYRYDGQGRLISVNSFDGRTESYAYDYAANPLAITRVTDGEGEVRELVYREQDGKTVVDRQIDAEGHDWAYDYDFDNRRTTVHQRSGSQIEYRYGEDRLTREQTYLPGGQQVRFDYDARGNSTHRINELGQTTELAYDERGNVTRQTDPEGRISTFERDSDGRLIAQTDGAGYTTRYERNSQGQVTRIVLPTGAEIRQQWSGPLLVRRVDEADHITEWTYDNNGYPSRIDYHDAVTGEQARELYDYDAVGRVRRVEDALGRVTTYGYSDPNTGRSLDQPTRITDPAGRTAVYRYDRNNNLLFERDFSGVETHLTYTPRGEVATRHIVMPDPDGGEPVTYRYAYEYDAENRLVRAEQPGDMTWAYSYDSRGNMVRSELLGTSVAQTFDYDAAGRRIAEEDSTGARFEFDYDATGQVLSERNPLGNQRRFDYDARGALQRINDQGIGAEVVSFQRDGLGRVTAETDARYQTVHYRLDGRGEVTGISAPDQPGQLRQELTRNQRGQVLSERDATGGEQTLTYDAAGQLIHVEDSEGGETTFEYDDLGRSLLREDPSGLQTTWDYQQTAQYLEIRRTAYDPALPNNRLDRRRTETERYDLMGRLIFTEDAAGQQWQYDYDERGLLSAIHSPDDSVLHHDYNTAGHLIEERWVSPEGEVRVTRYERDAQGRVTRRMAPHGAETRYTYNGLGQITEVLLPDGIHRIRHEYDPTGRRTATHYPEGLSEYWQYDRAGNVVRHTDRAGETWVYRYNADNQVSEAHDPTSVAQGQSHPTRYHYDALGRPTGVTDPNGHRQDQTRDSLGRVIAETDAEGHRRSFERDSAGRVIAETNPLGHTTRLDYNAFGDPETVADAAGHSTRFTYDALGRVIEQQNALGQRTQRQYNYRGQVTTETNARGHSTDYDYNAFGELTAVTLPDGATTQYDRDQGGRLSAVTDARGHRTTHQYNDRDELIRETNPLGQSTHYEYDGAGRVTRVRQPEPGTDIEMAYNGRDQLLERRFQGSTERWQYDAAGRLSGIDSPASTESYTRDPAGNKVEVDNRTLNQRLEFDYDANNRRIRMSDPNGGSGTHYERDAAGRVSELTYNGETTRFNRDELGRITERRLPNDTRDLTAYDPLGRVQARVLQQRDSTESGFDDRFFRDFHTPSHSTWSAHRFDFQALQQDLNREHNDSGWATEDQHLYFHDAEGNLSARLYNEKFAFFYDYDENDRLIRADEPENLTTTYEWDAVGNLTRKQVRDLQYRYQYNEDNQLVQADHWRLRHSGAGNSRGGGPAYNHNGVLSVWDIHHLDQQHQFEYLWDPSVNHTQTQLTQRYDYNRNGQLQQVDLGNGEQEIYQHDALGRLTGQTTEYGAQYLHAYDARDRRVSTELSDWDRSYAYQSLYDGRQEHSQWDEHNNPYRSLNYLPGEPAGNGGPGSLPQEANYGTLISQEVHQWENDEFRVTGFAKNYADKAYFHQDHLGSTVKITGEDPDNAFRWDYTPQGEAYGFKHRYSHEQMTRTHVGHSPKRHLVPYLYTGEYETNLSGLIHMDARWYNPQLGRWLQPDHYSFSQLSLPNSARHQLLGKTSLNTQHLLRDPAQQMAYGYVSGNPLRWVDPMGLFISPGTLLIISNVTPPPPDGTYVVGGGKGVAGTFTSTVVDGEVESFEIMGGVGDGLTAQFYPEVSSGQLGSGSEESGLKINIFEISGCTGFGRCLQGGVSINPTSEGEANLAASASGGVGYGGLVMGAAVGYRHVFNNCP